MSKAFPPETDANADEDGDDTSVMNVTVKNYVTPDGLRAMQDELRQLMRVERRKVVEIVSWAAGNGDRSENGDYIYGKKRLREIDKRARYLTKRIESAEPVDPDRQKNKSQVFFGAIVTYVRSDDSEQTAQIVGVDEAELAQGKISWLSPIAKALLKARVGDVISVRTPSGVDTLEILKIAYR